VNKRWLLFGGFGLALLVTPYLACSSHEGSADTSYSEADVKAAVLGTWQGSAEIDGETVPFSLVLEPLVGKAQTGGVISVTGTLTSEDPALNGVVDVHVGPSTRIALAMELRLDDGKRLSGSLEGGSIGDGEIATPGHGRGSFSLARP
jgi:hypothetical protein